MSKKQYIKRHIIIINKLRKNPSSFEEIRTHLQRHSEIDEENYEVSIRTFQRDVKEIASIYNIIIECNQSQNVYEITHDANEDRNERLIESFEIFNAINLSSSLQNHIIVEKRKPIGTEHMYGLLHAIKNNLEIKFTYERYWVEEENKMARTVKPLALKEARYRWYLVAFDLKDNEIKTFGLDRISNLDITQKKFVLAEKYDLEEVFRYSFGIITDMHKPQKIVLSFSFGQGKYIKSLPLHHSQKEIINSENEYRIELLLYPTYDFLMELLSIGSEVKVLQPESLQIEIKNRLSETLKLYE